MRKVKLRSSHEDSRDVFKPRRVRVPGGIQRFTISGSQWRSLMSVVCLTDQRSGRQLPLPLRGSVKRRLPSTGFAPPARTRAALHPWLQPGAPSGRRAAMLPALHGHWPPDLARRPHHSTQESSEVRLRSITVAACAKFDRTTVRPRCGGNGPHSEAGFAAMRTGGTAARRCSRPVSERGAFGTGRCPARRGCGALARRSIGSANAKRAI